MTMQNNNPPSFGTHLVHIWTAKSSRLAHYFFFCHSKPDLAQRYYFAQYVSDISR